MSRLQQVTTRTLKAVLHFGLWCYFKEIQVHGFSKEHQHTAVVYVANHQNALLDALLIATTTKKKTTFLTRSDAFKNPVMGAFLRYIGMLPIYRFRDGVNTVRKNTPIFEACGKVLDQEEAILIFPEGNHGLKREVRPLKKGFVTLLAHRWRIKKEAVVLAPIGFNYKAATVFPDRVALYFGPPITVAPFNIKTHNNTASLLAKVHLALSRLTTHITLDSKAQYAAVEAQLKATGNHFLNPVKTNKLWPKLVAFNAEHPTSIAGTKNKRHPVFKSFFKLIFRAINVLPIFIWRRFLKPNIVQEEFISTARFGFSMVFYPLYFILIGLFIAVVFKQTGMALAIPVALFLNNLIMVKKLL